MAGITIPLNVVGYQKTKKELEDINGLQERGIELTEEQQKQQKGLQKALDGTNEAVKEAVKSNTKLAESYEFNEEGMLEVTGTISKLEDQMYAMVIAGEAGSKQFLEIQEETARLRKVIIETDRSVDTLAENQGLGRVGAGLGIVGQRLLSLDFAGAGREAQIMSNNMSNLGSIGATALKGLTQTVSGLSKAFIKMGVALLANPIFLIVAAFVAIGVAIVALMESLGILQPVLDAIGAAFEWIKGIIDTVIQGFKDFTDWIGITNNAAKDFAQSLIDNVQVVADKNAEVLDNYTSAIDQEIRLRQLAGEETVELEIKKQRALIKSGEVAINNINKEIEARKLLGDVTEEELAALEKSITEQEKVIRNANNEIEFINAQHNKKIEDEDDKSYNDRLAKAKEYGNNRLAAERLIQDLELQLLQDGVEKEVDANDIKYDRLIEDTKNNENLLQSEKKAIVDFYEQLRTEEEEEIRQKDKDKADERAAKIREEEDKLFQEKIDREDAQFNLLQEIRNSEQEQEIANLVGEFEKKFELAAGNQELEAALEQEQKDRLKEINDKFEDDKTQKQKEEDEKRKASQQAVIQAGIDATSQSLTAIGDLNNLIFDNKRKNLKKGSAAEIAAAKKQFEINKKVQIAQALIQGVQAVLSAYSSGSAIPIVGAVTGPLFAALAAVSVATNVAKIKNQTFEGGGSSPSAPSSGSASSITNAAQSAAPSFEAFASGGTNEAELSESVEGNQQPIVVEAVVSEVEITETQDRIQTINKNSEL